MITLLDIVKNNKHLILFLEQVEIAINTQDLLGVLALLLFYLGCLHGCFPVCKTISSCKLMIYPLFCVHIIPQKHVTKSKQTNDCYLKSLSSLFWEDYQNI